MINRIYKLENSFLETTNNVYNFFYKDIIINKFNNSIISNNMPKIKDNFNLFNEYYKYNNGNNLNNRNILFPIIQHNNIIFNKDINTK